MYLSELVKKKSSSTNTRSANDDLLLVIIHDVQKKNNNKKNTKLLLGTNYKISHGCRIWNTVGLYTFVRLNVLHLLDYLL